MKERIAIEILATITEMIFAGDNRRLGDLRPSPGGLCHISRNNHIAFSRLRISSSLNDPFVLLRLLKRVFYDKPTLKSFLPSDFTIEQFRKNRWTIEARRSFPLMLGLARHGWVSLRMHAL